MSNRDKSAVAESKQGNDYATNPFLEIVKANERNDLSKEAHEISPYVDSDIISLDIGSSATRFLVHSFMLRKSAPLFALASKEHPVSLPKLDEGPAHTLVHHLYAGTFETKLGYVAVGKFRHSTCVYCAAVQYQLPSLAELSKDKIVEAGEGLPIFDIIQVARDQAFPLLPEQDVWYSQYLENVIQKAMDNDPEPFRKPDFITRVEGNSRLLQIVWKTVMSNYAITSAPGSTKESGAETPMAESMITESEAPTQSSQHQLPSPTESVIDSPPTSRAADDLIEPQPLELDTAATEQSEKQTQVSRKGSEPKGAIDATFNDDFGLPAIDPSTEQPEVLQVGSKPGQDFKKLTHVRTDSVVEEDAVVPDSTFESTKRDSVSEAPPSATNGNNDIGKKGKKKNKKKSSIIF